MLKTKKLITCIIISLLLTSCCLNKADRDLLEQSSIDSRAAMLSSEESAKSANEAAQKVERIFKQFQKK